MIRSESSSTELDDYMQQNVEEILFSSRDASLPPKSMQAPNLPPQRSLDPQTSSSQRLIKLHDVYQQVQMDIGMDAAPCDSYPTFHLQRNVNYKLAKPPHQLNQMNTVPVQLISPVFATSSENRCDLLLQPLSTKTVNIYPEPQNLD